MQDNYSRKSVTLLISKLISAISAVTRGRDVRAYIDRRERIMDELIDRGAAAVEPLLELMRTRSDNVCEHVAIVLGRIAAPESVIPLAQILAEPYPQATKRCAAKALMAIKTPDAVLAVNIWHSRVTKTRDVMEMFAREGSDDADLQACLNALAEQHRVGAARIADAYLLITSPQNLSSDALMRLNALQLSPEECLAIEQAAG